MAEAVLMPQVGISVESCIITSWLKKVGDTVTVGDILFTYETDKSSLECESTTAGEILEIFFNDGDEVPVLTAVCVIGKSGEDISPLRPTDNNHIATETKAVEATSVPSAVAISESTGPEATPVLMPQVGISVESCIITSWLKKVGDTVAVGDILFTYETDKASLECESTAAGEILEIFFADGDEVPVLVPVCAVGSKGDNTAPFRPDGVAVSVVAHSIAVQDKAAMPLITGNIDTKNIKISPRAKNLAKDKHIDITQAVPTGPYGRIIERDIRHMLDQGIGVMTSAAYEQGIGIQSGSGVGGRVSVNDLSEAATSAIAAPQVAASDKPEYQDIPFTGIRKAISRNMSHSLATIPQLTHNHSFDATEIMSYRQKLKENGESLGLPNITLNDFVLYAISRIILKHPQLNAHMLDDNNIRYFNNVHLGLAVDTPKGLLVPVIKYANLKSLAEIAAEASAIGKAAKDGTLSPEQMSGATFTISNLGIIGVESFTPVINPPETGIMGVDNIITRVREKDGVITTYPAMGLSLTYDHRAIDGAPASRFAQELCKVLESFTLLLAE